MLDLPLFERLRTAGRVLVAGAGGGFDLLSGLPLAFALHKQGKEVHLASLSFTYLDATDARHLNLRIEAFREQCVIRPRQQIPV